MDGLNDFDGHPNVTITVLPVALGLVHIPRYRLAHLTRPIIKLVLQTNPTFLNISCNDTEVSIIAEEHDLASFVKIAAKDARRWHRRRAQEAKDVLSGAPSSTASPRRKPAHRPVEVSSSWSALQIDSHGDQLGDASARIREISALLSGISILYQSSYTTDFIFVQSKLLPEVFSILANAKVLSANDFTSQMSSLVSSGSVSDPSTRSCSPVAAAEDPLLDFPLEDDPVVRSRRGTTSSHASLHSLLLAKSASVQALEYLRSPSPQKILPEIPPPPPLSLPSPSRGGGQLSPCRPDVSILPTDLVVVGLNRDSDHLVEAWSMKLIKLLLFRETLFPTARDGDNRTTEEDVERGREERRAAWAFGGDEGAWDGDDSDSSASFSSSSSSSSSSMDSFHSAESDLDAGGNVRAPSSDAPLPFFSLTRTAEETSLMSDVKLLAALFPAHEREGMVIGGDVFDRVDGASGVGSDDGSTSERVFKCLHVNLEDYGLDRHGLVNRFSDVLHSNAIHHLYCSTVKTANLLVDERDAERAQILLREC